MPKTPPTPRDGQESETSRPKTSLTSRMNYDHLLVSRKRMVPQNAITPSKTYQPKIIIRALAEFSLALFCFLAALDLRSDSFILILHLSISLQ